MEGFSTPVIYTSSTGLQQLVVSGSKRLDAYSPDTGESLWWVGGKGYFPKGVPVLGPNTVFLSAPGNDTLELPPYEDFLKVFDANGDGRLAHEEVRANAEAYEHLDWFDSNGDGVCDEDEYNFIRTQTVAGHGFVAVRLGGHGDLTEESILWRYKKTYPNVPAPLLYKGVLYGIKDGGIIAALNPATGEVFKVGRTKEAIERYFSSPVAADDKIFLVSEFGKVSVLKAGED